MLSNSRRFKNIISDGRSQYDIFRGVMVTRMVLLLLL